MLEHRDMTGSFMESEWNQLVEEESFRLEKTSKIESNLWTNTTIALSAMSSC